MWRLVKTLYFIIAFFMVLLISFKAATYWYPVFSQGFLSNKQEVFSFYKFPLIFHAVFAPIALIVGIIQFSNKPKKLHPIFGKIYLFSIVIFAAPSGFVMAFYAIGGIVSSISFWILSLLWWIFTFKAFVEVKKGNIAIHKHYMIMSFLLTNSAILLRILGFINMQFLHYDTEKTYIVISWLCWLPILGIYLLKRRFHIPENH